MFIRSLKHKIPLTQLAKRTMLASVSNLVIGSGVYPLVLHTGMSMNRRRLGKSNIPHAGRIAMQEWALALSFSALQKKEGLRPVILLHGYGMSRASYLWLAGQLSAKEWTRDAPSVREKIGSSGPIKSTCCAPVFAQTNSM